MSESSTIRWDRDEDGIVVLTLDDPNRSANTMNAAYKASMAATVDRLEAECDEITGVVITSAKNTFFAGGDLHELKRATKADAPQIATEMREINRQLRRLETLGKPVAAAINGAALGGGLEICLACHHRVALDDPKVQLGFPEVQLGLLPGAGGVARTVRMLGLVDALMQLLLQGQRHRPAKAKELGIIDDLVAAPDELVPAAKAWVKANPEATQPWDVKGHKIPGGTPSNPKLAQNLPAFPANLRKQLKGAGYPAPHHIMAAAVEGAQVDFDNAIEIEGRYFVNLVTGQVAKNMIQAFFFDLQRVNGERRRPEGIEPFAPRKMVVLGAGMMGAAISYVCAKAGIEVVLKDVSLEAAQEGKAYSRGLVEKAVSRGRSTQEQADALLARITPTADAADADGAELVIEAVFEDPEVKARVFAEIEPHLAPDALLGSNTSTLPITGLAEACEQTRGLHRPALLQPGRQDAATRGDQGREDERDDALPRARPRQADQEDPDRRPRQPRVLHQPCNRHVHRGGHRDAAGGGAGGDDRAGLLTGRLSDACAAALGRGESRADAQDPRRIEGGRRGPGGAVGRAPDGAGNRPHARRVRAPRAPAGAGFYDYSDGKRIGLWPGLRNAFPPVQDPSALSLRDLEERFCSSSRSRPRSASTRA